MPNSYSNAYTKEEIIYVLQNWGKLSPTEMAEYLKRPKNSLPYLAKAIREVGYDLPKHPRKEALKFVISEALAELGLKTEKGNK